MTKARLAEEVSWFTTVVFAICCHGLVIALGTWLNPSIRTGGYWIWMIGAGAFFAVWMIGVYAHGVKRRQQ